MDHFSQPRNVGVIKDPDGVGEVGNPACGDIMTFHIKVKEGKLEDVKFQTFGCGAAIAVSSMISEMAVGRKLEDALEISNKDVAEALDGLPTTKLHCSNLGADALHAAIRDYQKAKEGTGGTVKQARAGKKARIKKSSCKCTYCNVENSTDSILCQGCGASLEAA